MKKLVAWLKSRPTPALIIWGGFAAMMLALALVGLAGLEG